MFSGLLAAAAPSFAGRVFSALKPALSSAFEFLTDGGADRLADSASSLGLNKISKGIKSISNAARKLKTPAIDTYDMEFKKNVEREGNKLAPEDDDYEEFLRYKASKKRKLNEERPEYLN